MKKKPCSKCGTLENITRHHILPKCFWKGYGGTCSLCETHHKELEAIICLEEKNQSNNPVRRFQLTKKEYRKLLTDYIK